jgi:hypothetical protein
MPNLYVVRVRRMNPPAVVTDKIEMQEVAAGGFQ